MTIERIHQSRPVVDLSKAPRGAIGDWLRKEIARETGKAILSEAKGQIRADNPPNAISIDGRGARKLSAQELSVLKNAPKDSAIRITGMRTKATLHFASVENLYEAVQFAYDRLTRQMRYLTGRGVGTIYFYCRDPGTEIRSRQLTDLMAVRNWVKETTDPLSSVHIIGPTVPYRLMLTYNPKGTQILRWRSASRATAGAARTRASVRLRTRTYASGRSRTSARVAIALHEQVARQTERAFPNLYVKYRWVRSKVGLGHRWGRNVPRIFIGLKGK